jgi:precorrin-2/cobalt-factor-2 C20-methyltransferase
MARGEARGEIMSGIVPGTIWGVGVGPGDPELVTVKAARLIGSADLIAYPAPEEGDSFARAIAASHMREGQREFAIRMKIGEGQYPKDEVYDAAADRLAQAAEAGQIVVVLCEGDPFFYGSFMYLYARVAGRVQVKVVPGVSSLMACAIATGGALAAKNDVLTIVPAPLPEAELKRRLAETEAAAIIKVGRHLPKVRKVLNELGLAQHTRYVEHATLDSQKVIRLDDLDGASAPYFSMLLVHRRGEAWS